MPRDKILSTKLVFGLLCALLATAVASPASSLASGGQAPGAGDPNPLIGQTWWDQNTKYNHAWNSGYRGLLRQGRTEEAQLVKLLAQQAQFRWWGPFEDRPKKPLPVQVNIRKSFATMDNQASGLVPLITVAGHKARHADCGPRYLAGGAREDARYRSFVRRLAAGIGSREVVIAFEPDGMATVECLARSRRRARIKMLRYGVKVMSKLPNATVYIDAGASDWQGVPTVTRKLRAFGINRVRGFMLNATHQDTTANNIRFGLKISRNLGGKHFIVNTSHNGNGSYRRNGVVNPCNPPNVAAGERPTTTTAHPLVDAYMWVEHPGYSNGACGGGPKRIGAWWEERALLMVRRAGWLQAALSGR